MITDPSWMVKRYSVTTLLNSQPHKPTKFRILIVDMGRKFYTYKQQNQLWNVHKTAVPNIKSTVAIILFSEISSTEKTLAKYQQYKIYCHKKFQRILTLHSIEKLCWIYLSCAYINMRLANTNKYQRTWIT